MNRHLDRSGLQSRRKVQEPTRHKDMTVCIAAMYQIRTGGKGIALITDRQITDTSTSHKSETGLKIASITSRITALGADDITKFHDLVNRVIAKLEAKSKADLTVKEAADMYLEAEADWRQEYLERHVLVDFGLTWESYKDRLANDELPQAYLDNIAKSIKACAVPYHTYVIIAGFNPDNTAHLYRVLPNSKDDFSSSGYAIIGEGDGVAEIEFKNAQYFRLWPRSQTLFLCYVAKKRSEVISSVGKTTALYVMEPDRPYTMVPKELKTQIDAEFKQLNNKIVEIERGAFSNAKKIIEEYREEDGQSWWESDE